jgi:chromosomal replication initiator protein
MSDRLWMSVLGQIELSVSKGNYMTWFKNTRLLKQEGNLFVIGVSSVFIKQTLEKRYAQVICDVLIGNGMSNPVLEFKTSALLAPKKAKEFEDDILSNPVQKSRPTPQNNSNAVSHAYRQGLNEKYTFDNFIVGSGSELAYAACQAVANNPGTKYNPLFLYGGVGIGKTHLIQAIGNALVDKGKGTRIVYATIEQFVQEFLDAIRYKKVGSFAEHYRGADVLIVDDIQFIAGKEKTQEEFFHTFNALHQSNKQIIISSDRKPSDIPTLSDRLKSRFSMGMSIDMQAPDFETRCAILQTKSAVNNVRLPKEVMEYLAQLITSNVRELEGLLNQLLAHCELKNVEPTLDIVSVVFGNQPRLKHVSSKQIIERTARFFQISVDDILSPKRDREIVQPRQIAMYLLRTELNMSFPKIARELGRKDHTTAMHSVEKLEKDIANDAMVQEYVKSIRERLYV